jgi:hypothetical protein
MNEKPTNALILLYFNTHYSHTCFGILECHHQGVRHDPAEIGAHCLGKQRWMKAGYCGRRRDVQDPTRFGVLECHHQGVKHDPAEIGA